MKKFSVSIFLIFYFLFSPWNLGRIIVLGAPTPPSAPSSPGAPSAPSSPDSPEAPKPPGDSGDDSQSNDDNSGDNGSWQPKAPTAPDQESQPVQPEAPKALASEGQAQQPAAPSISGEKTDGNRDVNNTNTGDGGLSASNTNTGSDSENNSSTKNNESTDVNQNNDAKVNNDLVLTSDTGGNNSDKNTGDGNVSSGNANVGGSVENKVNNNTTMVGGGSTGGYNSGSQVNNGQTGSNSSNNSNVEVNSDTMIVNNNTAELDNGVIAIADSGNNSADKNTGNGEVITGDANVGLTVVNVANTNIAGVKTSEYDVYDDHKGDIVIDLENGQSASNSKTGADSTNQADTNNNTSLTIVNNNDAKVANELVAEATTGRNTADKNTGDGSVKTGDANVVANVVNLVNNNLAAGTEIIVATVNVFGDLVGDIILAPLTGSSQQLANNSNTGAGSENESSSALNRVEDVYQNNEANIYNSTVINANTGNNYADKNTDGGNVSTGEVNVHAEEMTVANNNLSGTGEDTWWIVVVNEAGKWVGKILGADEGGNVAVVDTIDLDTSNENTGADSVNQATTENNSQQQVVQNNTADVNNSLVINANTGDNSTEKNTGSSNVESGDVNIYSNIVNYVNNNIAGGKVVVAFVNVFGSWIGDLVTPGNEKQKSPEGVGTNVSQAQDSSNVEDDQVTIEDEGSDMLAIGGPDLKEDPEYINYNYYYGGYGDNYEDDETSTTVERIRSYQTRNLGGQVSSDEDDADERVLAGVWMVEDDDYLKTTPTPGVSDTNEGDEEIDGNKEKQLVWLLLMSGPLGWGAWSLKRKVV